jgi:hypothetical protein
MLYRPRFEKESKAMFVIKRFGKIAFAMSLLATGCGSQSAAFRSMSAADHESAARAASSDPSLAKEHLDAANQLRYDEQVACDGVPDSDRGAGPFSPANVTDVAVVKDRGVFPKAPPVPVGVTVFLRAQPGLTAQWLGRIVECHRAHIAVAGGTDRPSPLAIQDAAVSVGTTFDGFRVTVTSKNTDVAHAIVDKGQQLAASTYGRPIHPVGIASAQ